MQVKDSQYFLVNSASGAGFYDLRRELLFHMVSLGILKIEKK